MIPAFFILHPIILGVAGTALLLAAAALRDAGWLVGPTGKRFAAPLKLSMYVLGGLLFTCSSLALAAHSLPAVIAFGIALTLAPWVIKRTHWLNGPYLARYVHLIKSVRLLGVLALCSCVPLVLLYLLVVFVTGIPNGA